MRFIVDSRREEEGFGAAGLRAVSKTQPPQSVNRNRLVPPIDHESFELPVLGVERRDFSRSKIPNQDAAAQFSKTFGRLGHRPWRIEETPMLKPPHQIASGAEHIDKSFSRTRHFI